MLKIFDIEMHHIKRVYATIAVILTAVMIAGAIVL